MKRSVPRLAGPAKTIAKSELIGRAVRIDESTDSGLVARSGVVVDETLNTLSIRDKGGRTMQVAKAACTFQFRLDSRRDWISVDGRAIQFRSEDRTKKVR